MGEKIRELLTALRTGKGALQFLRFGLVGVSNTLIQYGMEMLGYYVLMRDSAFPGTVELLGRLGIQATGEQVRVVAVTAMAFVVSVTNAYYWNNRFVFRQGKKTAGQHLRAYGKTVASYALTGLVISPVIKLWLGNLGAPYWLASLGSLAVTIPLNFVLNKFWAFGTKSER